MDEEDIDLEPYFQGIAFHYVRPGDTIQSKTPGTKFPDPNQPTTTTTTTTTTNPSPSSQPTEKENTLTNENTPQPSSSQPTEGTSQPEEKAVSNAGNVAAQPKKKPKRKPKEAAKAAGAAGGDDGHQFLELPPYTGPNMSVQVDSGSVALQGCRPSMEDTHVTLNQLSEQDVDKDTCFYGVYDGHGGKDAAEVVGEHLHRVFAECEAFSEGDVERGLKESFIETDNRVLEVGTEQGWKSGTTAVVIILQGTKLFVANIGDSEAVLARRVDEVGHKAILLTEKHTTALPSEKKRILSQGGTVIFGRVFGDLVVTRAFGDSDYKPPKSESSFISCEPYVRKVDLNPERDDFFILACDGLWDVFKYQDAVDFVLERKKEGKSAAEVSQMLGEEALVRKSQDNTTVTVVYLNWEPTEQ